MSDTPLARYEMYINGRRTPAASARTYLSDDPYIGAPWAEVPDGDAADVELAVRAARSALEGPWGAMTGAQRGALLRKLGDIFAAKSDELARVETRDNGRLLKDFQTQMRMLPEWYYYFAGLADKINGEAVDSGKSNFLVYTTHEPVGVVGAIVPWNSPLWLVTWKLAPALAAGCTFVLKPSDYSPVSGLAFADLVHEAGFPPGVFNVVSGNGPAVGRALVAHPGVDKISFTGSTQVGIEVAKAAANNVTGVLLELGGKSAHVIFSDADLDNAVNGVVAGVFAATGQTCMAGSRVLVHESIHDDFIDRLVNRTKKIRLGDPNDVDTDMGPISNRVQFEKIIGYLEGARNEGATAAVGGGASSLGGLFIEPTVLVDTKPGMRVVDEEIFGPVVSVMRFSTETEAIEMANSNEFGLAGAVWTQNIHRGHRVAGRLKAGTVWINAYRTLSPSVPFGGFKKSGLGRENGMAAVHEFTESKSVWVELSGKTRDPFIMG